MSDKVFNMLVRVVLNRVRLGEDIDEVLDSYKSLGEEEKSKIKTVVLALK